MRRTGFAGVVVGTGSLLLGGCTVDQPAEPLAKTIPVAAVLILVPIVLAVAGGRVLRRRLVSRWPAPEGRDLRRPLALLPLLGALAYPLFVWLFFAGETGFGFREDDIGFWSWTDAVSYAAVGGLVAAFGTLLTIWLGTAVLRERRWILVLLTVVAAGALLVQVVFALQPRQDHPAGLIAGVEAAYLLVVGSLLVGRRSGVTPPWAPGGDAGTVDLMAGPGRPTGSGYPARR